MREREKEKERGNSTKHLSENSLCEKKFTAMITSLLPPPSLRLYRLSDGY